MKKEYDVSIILVNYNGKHYIDMLMDGLCHLKHSDFTYEVVFVDNDSKDGSADYIRENYADQCNLKVVESGSNLGFAAGNNFGVKHAAGDYIVFLNNDTRPEENWLEELYHYIKSKKDVVMANAKLLFFYDFIQVKFYTRDKIILKKEIQINGKSYQIDNKFCKNLLYEQDRLVCFGHTEINIPLLDGISDYEIVFEAIECAEDDKILWNEKELLFVERKNVLQLPEEEVMQKKFALVQNAGSGINENYDGFDIGFCQLDGEEFAKEYEITNGCGASIIMKKEDFVSAGMFDEKFFMYYEDTDLSFRMKKGGRKIMYCPTAVVRHVHAGSSTEWSPFFTYHVCRNKLFFVRKNFGFKVFFKFFWGQLKSGLRERNKSKVKGTLDSVLKW